MEKIYLSITEYFNSKETCLNHLVKIKWKEGFSCIKCGSKNYTETESFDRICSNCGHINTPVENTLFENIDFSLKKAFWLFYKLTDGSNNNSLNKTALTLNLNIFDVWVFSRKIKKMKKKEHKIILEKSIFHI